MNVMPPDTRPLRALTDAEAADALAGRRSFHVRDRYSSAEGWTHGAMPNSSVFLLFGWHPTENRPHYATRPEHLAVIDHQI